MIKRVLARLLRTSQAGSKFLAIRSLVNNGYLNESGWIRSALAGMPVDGEQRPVPWYTYGSIEFLSRRVKSDMVVFEYGSGNSTLWWSARVARVVSCEHDHQWFELMSSKLAANVDYNFVEMSRGDDYSKRISRHEGEFDIVVIDGRDRVNCAKNSLPALKASGVILWDNSDRSDYAEGYDFLLGRGFKRLDFWGMGPINNYGWCTSVFYRPANGLEI